MGDVCSKPVCQRYLEDMLRDDYIPPLYRIPGWDALGPRRQAVLISFGWNLGPNFYGAPGFETISNVLREGALKPRAYSEMPDALNLYVHANGVELEGLKIRRRQEGRLWQCEDDGEMKFKCLLPTFLKKAAIESSYLSNDGKQGFETGETIDVVKVEVMAEDSHAWVTLADSNEQWAIYLPHWQEVSSRPSLDIKEKVDWGDFSAHVGPYVTVGELLSYDKRRRPVDGSKEEEELFYISGQYGLIREAWGGPLGITSGFRPEPVNTRVGGHPGSYHTKGMALDVYPVGESCSAFYKWLAKRWTGGLGDGCHKGFVHIDTRDGGEFHARAGVKPSTIWSY
tara:strand:- start:157 stop:1176 length:1020 start_codon:yes stop_codon:yes gene_type:complete